MKLAQVFSGNSTSEEKKSDFPKPQHPIEKPIDSKKESKNETLSEKRSDDEKFMHLGILSFTTAMKKINSEFSKKQKMRIGFEEKAHGIEWEISINKVSPEIKVDADGKKWRRIY